MKYGDSAETGSETTTLKHEELLPKKAKTAFGLFSWALTPEVKKEQPGDEKFVSYLTDATCDQLYAN